MTGRIGSENTSIRHFQMANKRANSSRINCISCAFKKAFIFHVQHLHFVMEESLMLPSGLLKMRNEGHLRKYNKKKIIIIISSEFNLVVLIFTLKNDFNKGTIARHP